MREIKFRAWDKEAKKFWWWEDLKTKTANFFELNFLDVQQYTGLLDKNGKEIYEGDVLQYPSFEHGSRIFEVMDAMKDYRWLVDVINYSEIIGNIYENKELLDK
jgi:hypothetical protein